MWMGESIYTIESLRTSYVNANVNVKLLCPHAPFPNPAMNGNYSDKPPTAIARIRPFLICRPEKA